MIALGTQHLMRGTEATIKKEPPLGKSFGY